jgi:hypothetical protein
MFMPEVIVAVDGEMLLYELALKTFSTHDSQPLLSAATAGKHPGHATPRENCAHVTADSHSGSRRAKPLPAREFPG